MSYIISSGNKKPQWVPEPKAKKTAQLDVVVDEAPVQEEESSNFFDAVKDLPGIKEQATSLEQAIETATEAVEAVKEVALAEGVIQPKQVGATPISETPAPVAPMTPVDGAKSDLPAIEAPKAEGEVKPEEKKDENPFAKKDEAPKAEGEVKIEEKPADKPAEEKAVDQVEIEIPGVKDDEKKDDGVEKESCGMNVGASVTDGKLKAIAKLSPENRKDLGKFWKDDLGMPADWVDAMLKDY